MWLSNGYAYTLVHPSITLGSALQVAHHGAELVVVDDAVAILVHLLDDVLDAVLADAHLLQALGSEGSRGRGDDERQVGMAQGQQLILRDNK